MCKFKLTKLKNQKGITLIALIVTIVLLLILAGTTITLLFRENGIIDSAQEAKKSMEGAGEKENVAVMVANFKIKKYTENAKLKDYFEENEERLGITNVEGDNNEITFEYNGYTVIITDEGDNYIVGKESMILNKTALTLDVDVTDTLTARIFPSSKSQAVTWSVTGDAVTIGTDGKVTAVKEGKAVVTATSTADTTKTASCNITVLNDYAWTDKSSGINYTWADINSIANLIANDNTINPAGPATVRYKDRNVTLKIGDIMNVKNKKNNKKYDVRILGFRYDDLAENTGKAGISFDFAEIIANEKQMDSSISLPAKLNGTSAANKNEIVNYSNFNNASYIKKVKKGTAEQYFWLLACAEIWPKDTNSNKWAFSSTDETITNEISKGQYPLYKNLVGTIPYDSENTNLTKKLENSNSSWWLRSVNSMTTATSFITFGVINNSGKCNTSLPTLSNGVAPGFCI